MAEVERSESLRSDGAGGAVGAQKPRVSFNRDVHIKRIGPRSAQTTPNASPKPAVRKQRLGKFSDEQLAREAAYVIRQADRVNCRAFPGDKFSSLPIRRKNANSKLVARSNSLKSNSKQTPRSSIFSIFKKIDTTNESENRNPSKPVGRSKSDVSDKSRSFVTDNFRKRTGSESEDYLNSVKEQKKQLSPIIEISAREDYFAKPNSSDITDGLDTSLAQNDLLNKNNKNKKNTNLFSKKPKIDDNNQHKKNDKENINPEKNNIEIDKTTNKTNLIDTIQKNIDNFENNIKVEKDENMVHSSQKPTEKPLLTKGHKVDKLVKKISNETPVEFPLTNLLVSPGTAQYNNNQPFSYTRPSISPEPIIYNHNNTDSNISNVPGHIIYAQVVRNNDSNGINKQTVHTSFSKPKTQSDEEEDLGYEDSNKTNVDYLQQFEDSYKSLSDYNTDNDLPISPILREYKAESYHKDYTSRHDRNINLPARGRADGMDSKRKENIIEPSFYTPDRADLSYRRNLLQSRFNSRKLPDLNYSDEDLFDKSNKHSRETELKSTRKNNRSSIDVTDNALYKDSSHFDSKWYHRDIDANRKLFLDSQLNDETLDTLFDYEHFNEANQKAKERNPWKNEKYLGHSSSHSKKYMKEERSTPSRNHYRSNPEIVSRKDDVSDFSYDYDKPESYHNSLQRHNREENVKKIYNYEEMIGSLPKCEKTMFGLENFDENPERKDKLVDSGIENDYRKDSNGEIDQNNSTDQKFSKSKRLVGGESDQDANSDLVYKTRYTENNVKHKRNGDDYKYRSDEKYVIDGDYKNFENKTQKVAPKKNDENKYIERSIDDGSLYDPKIDKTPEKKYTSAQKVNKVDKKIQKDYKKTSNLEKVKQLFSSKKQKKDKTETMVKEEDLRARYTEYKGTAENRDSSNDDAGEKTWGTLKSSRESRHNKVTDYGSRRRLSTPSASPSPTRRETPVKDNSSNWFKSLDRLTRRNKNRLKNKDVMDSSKISEYPQSSTSGGSRNASRLALRHSSSPLPGIHYNHTLQKNLRFFGDTDLESNASISKHKTNRKVRQPLDKSKNEKLYSSTQLLSKLNKNKKRVASLSALNKDSPIDGRQQLLMNSYNQEKFSNQNIHNVSEIQSDIGEEPIVKSNFKYLDEGKENIKNSRNDINDHRLIKKPPMSPLKENRKNDKYVSSKDTLTRMHKSKSDLSDRDYRRRRPDIGGTSSIESSTEGDSSQQSQNSIVYLHAATVGDIPGPRRRNERSASREELSVLNPSRLQPQVKTVSRSISVLAPWKPRHIREGYDINYSQMQNNSTIARSKNKLNKPSTPDREPNQKMNLRNGSVTLNRRTKYENNEKHSSNNSLYRKNRYKNGYDSSLDHKQHAKIKLASAEKSKIDKNGHSGSIEAISTSNRKRNEKLSRSISMPRDTKKPTGWFRMTNNNKN